jgi:hypothetical protein
LYQNKRNRFDDSEKKRRRLNQKHNYGKNINSLRRKPGNNKSI